MGKIIIAQMKRPLCTIQRRRADEICSEGTLFLVRRQNLIYVDGNDFSIPVTKAEFHGSDLPICIRAGNHLHGDIYAQNAFHGHALPIIKKMI